MKSKLQSAEVLRLEDVSKVFTFDGHHAFALRDVSLDSSFGELLLLLGPSGSGKTTLLTLLAGLAKPTSGTLHLFERNIETYSQKELQRLRACKMGFVFQDFLLIDALTVLQNIVLVGRFCGKSKAESARRGYLLLEQLRISHLAHKYPDKLSQGEKQRVAIARALCNDAELIIADEPTASLESKQGFEIIQLLHGLAYAEHKCVVIASHDLRLEQFASRALRLEDGHVIHEQKSQSSQSGILGSRRAETECSTNSFRTG